MKILYNHDTICLNYENLSLIQYAPNYINNTTHLKDAMELHNGFRSTKAAAKVHEAPYRPCLELEVTILTSPENCQVKI